VAPHANDDVVTRVLEVERVRAALTAVAEDRDARAGERLTIDVFLRVRTHFKDSLGGKWCFQCPKRRTPRRLGRCGVLVLHRVIALSARSPAPPVGKQDEQSK